MIIIIVPVISQPKRNEISCALGNALIDMPS